MIEAILPAAAAWSEHFIDPSDARLFAEEEALLGNAVEKRRREFATGRLCARQALAKLGIAAAPIARGERGAPQWPPGIVGSITHCAGYRAATAGWATDFATLGIDAEPDLPLPEGLLEMIARPRELDQIRALGRARPRGPAWDRLLFCAKEALYKAWFPLAQRWLSFDEAEVTIDPVTGTLGARPLVPGPSIGELEVTEFPGRWLARDGLIVVAIAVSARGRSGPSQPAGVSGCDELTLD